MDRLPLYQVLFSVAALLVVVFVAQWFLFVWVLVTIGFIFVEEKKGYKIHRYVKDNYPAIYERCRSYARQNKENEFILRVNKLSEADVHEMKSEEIKGLVYGYRRFRRAMIISFILFLSSGVWIYLLREKVTGV